MNKILNRIAAFLFLTNYFLFAQIDPSVPENWQNSGYRGDIPRTFSKIINMKNSPINLQGNGTTDDSPALQAAINNKIANSPNEMTIFYFPAGTYKLNNTISIPDGAKNILFM